MPSLVARSTATIEKTGLLTVVVMWDTGSSGSVQFDSTGRVWGGTVMGGRGVEIVGLGMIVRIDGFIRQFL